MSSYKLEYKLKQQTPMIHFQYDQSGATLRATEVKPKLDKFIKSKCNVDDSWLIGCEDGDKKALNYKLRISVVPNDGFEMKNCVEISDKIDKMYFGNMGLDEDDENRKQTVLYDSCKCDIELTVICFIPELLKVIDDNIAEFFAVHNFGTRQSKGFGGFSLQKEDGSEPYSEKNIVELLTDKYKFFYVEADKKEDTFPLANSIYTTMKSGIDRPNQKVKINGKNIKIKINGYLLNQYFKDNQTFGAGSDKDMMAAKMFPVKDDNKYKASQNYIFTRALLGLTDTYEFKLGGRNGKISVEDKKKEKDGKPVIQRFPSPVTIKIVGKTILFIFNENLLKEIMGKWFIFTVAEPNTPEKPQKYKALKGYDELPIQVPQKFDIDKFISDFVKFYNADNNEEVSRIKNVDDDGYKYKYSEKGISISKKAGGK